MSIDMERAKSDLSNHENAIEEAQSCMCGVCHSCGFDPDEMRAALAEIERLQGSPKEGMYGKYRIAKADGSPVDPNADYFVLRLDTDPIARRAAWEYSYYALSSGGDLQLVKDLQARLMQYDPKKEDCMALRYVGVLKSELVEKYEAQATQIRKLDDEVRKQTGFALQWKELASRRDEQIRELEGWLVEAQARIFYQFGDMELDATESDRRMTREQLIAEGKIVSGEHVSGSTKLMLTKEQREAIQGAIFMMNGYDLPYIKKQMKVLETMLSGSRPAWAATEEREHALRFIMYYLENDIMHQFRSECHDWVGMLRRMLEEARP